MPYLTYCPLQVRLNIVSGTPRAVRRRAVERANISEPDATIRVSCPGIRVNHQRSRLGRDYSIETTRPEGGKN